MTDAICLVDRQGLTRWFKATASDISVAMARNSHSATQGVRREFSVPASKATEMHSQTFLAYLSDARVRTGSSWVTIFQKELASFKQFARGWDTYDAPPPRQEAIDAASDFINYMWSLDPTFSPTRIAPTVDGSVVVSFLNDMTRANVEFFDSEEIAAMIASKDKEEPLVWEIGNGNTLDEALNDIRNALEARPPIENVQMGAAATTER